MFFHKGRTFRYESAPVNKSSLTREKYREKINVRVRFTEYTADRSTTVPRAAILLASATVDPLVDTWCMGTPL